MMTAIIRKTILHILAMAKPSQCKQVIYYHDIGREHLKTGTSLELFREHVAYAIGHGWHFCDTIEELKAYDGNALMVCFDDGFKGIWDNRHLLISWNIHPTVFLAVDLVGNPGYLNWNEIKELRRHGFIFQSHTWSHRSLTDVPDDELIHELEDSRRMLSEHLGYDVNQLCFPRGLFSKGIVDACKTAGYRYLFTSIPGTFGDEVVKGVFWGEIELIPRVLVQAADVSDFKCLLQGAMAWFRLRYVHMHYRKKREKRGL